jgi:tRNA-Thr(GGU) m(6)t(6)A37 methyltransferase TsaA
MTTDRFAQRPGEVRLGRDPAQINDATLAFIGHARTEWGPQNCPKNLRQAREEGHGASIEISEPYRPGLEGLAAGDLVIVLYWMDRAPRDLIRQVPRHRPEGAGVFALRSPLRPNPLAMGVLRVTSVDPTGGVIRLDALDCYDGTPIIDVKPWKPSVDIPPDA